ncbi:protein SIEVE ELEMENT OCCLUSION B-like [Durio zibethinus]|uniref:Protein SIEVE ELEMENT OCCLUSION B-like n=1 Tax=Durio zibethinus TaxID=66656 RepID=A0A6P5Z5R4_DURZI|nr:protein SIEVE ELEMENT OCCLUSION B-like [Durio zibethinus]
MTSLTGSDGINQALADIHKISCKMSCNHSGQVVATTVYLLETLKHYSWNQKVVLVVAAFALSFGEFWLLVSRRDEDPIAKSVNLLKGCLLIPDFNELVKLLRAMMVAVNSNFAFCVLPTSYIKKETSSMMGAIKYFPNPSCQIICRVVYIASTLGKEKVNNLNDFAEEIGKMNTTLQEKLKCCQEEVDEHRQKEYQYICDLIGQSKDQIQIIAKLTGKNENQVPERLKDRHVILLISDFNISIEEIKVLNQLIKKDHLYEMIWIPFGERLSSERNKFLELKKYMISFTFFEPFDIEQAVIEFIKKDWHFIKNPIAVSLKGGEVTCRNALPMLLTWGNSAFPFTDKTEKDKWDKMDKKWKLDLLVDEQIIGQDIESWKKKETVVCFFGGANIEWIKNFTAEVKVAAEATGVSLKMAYVGNNKGKGLARNELSLAKIHVIESEFQWHFWARFKSILQTKIQHGKTCKSDRIMQETMKILNYDGSGKEWAIFGMGSDVMVTMNGKTAITIMSKYKEWKKDVAKPRFFLQGIRSYMTKLSVDHGCIEVHLPVLGQLPGIVFCPKCYREMEMYYTYRCCDE